MYESNKTCDIIARIFDAIVITMYHNGSNYYAKVIARKTGLFLDTCIYNFFVIFLYEKHPSIYEIEF